MAGQLRAQLPGQATLRDAARLQVQDYASSGAWMMASPHVIQAATDAHFDSVTYKLSLKWWLGLPLIGGRYVGAPCPLCQEPLDSYGDHLLCCKHNQPIKRHDQLVKVVMSICEEAYISL